MRSVLVTGASGLIGQAVCSALAVKKFDVIGFDSTPSVFEHERFRFIKGNVSDKDSFNGALSECRPEIVIHLACSVDNDFPAIISDREEKASAATDKHIYRTAASMDVKDFYLLSTHQVYAVQKTREPIREIAVERPSTVYGKMKLESERALLSAVKKGGMNGVIMRTCPIYTKEYTENLHARIFDPKENCAFIYGYGDYGYSFTCVYNISDFICSALTASGVVCHGVYNVCDNNNIKAKEIVEFERESRKINIVMQRKYTADNVKNVFFGAKVKNDYRYNDLSTACSNITYDNTKARQICSFHWKLSNTR